MANLSELDRLKRLADNTRLYARSKGLTFLGQGILFTAGTWPLLCTTLYLPHLSQVVSSVLYLLSSCFFLFTVWAALRFVPERLEEFYYARAGTVTATPRETPDWARFLAPLCIMAPIGAAGMGVLDAWQATAVGLTAFGLYMYGTGRYELREPATEMIGAITVLCGGLVAAVPGLSFRPGAVEGPEWVARVLEADYAALGITAWLTVGWVVSAIALHAYNTWLLSELKREAGGELDDGDEDERDDHPDA